MKKINRVFLTFIGCLFLLAVLFLIGFFSTKKVLAPSNKLSLTPVKTNTMSTPEITVLNFYDWYLKLKGNPLLNGDYKQSGYLTGGFKEKIQAQAKTGVGDPIICSLEKPQTIDIHQATNSGKLFYVVLTRVYPQKKADQTVILELIGNRYKISGVNCEK